MSGMEIQWYIFKTVTFRPDIFGISKTWLPNSISSIKQPWVTNQSLAFIKGFLVAILYPWV